MVVPVALAALRTAAKAKQAAAVRKVSRLKAKGVDIAGSEFDPRKSWNTVKNYNSKQLSAYSKRLDEFNNRYNRFVGTSDRSPVQLSEFRRYKAVEKAYNAIADNVLGTVGDMLPPGSGETINERFSGKLKNRPVGDTTNRPFTKHDLSSRNFRTPASMRKMFGALKAKLQPDYASKSNDSAMASVNKILDDLGEPDLKKAIGDLTEEQFNVLWNWTGFSELLVEKYISEKERRSGKRKELMTSDNLEEGFRLVNWASNLFQSEA